MKYLSIDPGGTTGVCRYDSDSRDFWLHQIPTTTVDEYGKFWKFLAYEHQAGVKTLICEQFNFRLQERTRTKINYTPAELIGIVKLFSWTFGLDLHFQMAAEGAIGPNVFWTEQKIRKLGLWKTSSPHAMDALGHMLQYVSFKENDKYFIGQLRPKQDLKGF
jgi:hypothetical protein